VTPMYELVLVLNIKAQTFLKSVFAWKWHTLLKNLSSLLIFGGFAVGVFFIARMTTQYLLFEAHIGMFLFHRFLSMLLYVFFVTINLGNMIVSYATLYRSQEVSFLMAHPVDHAKIFLIKFVDNFFYSSTTLSLIGFAVLLGYGSVFTLPWYSYLFVTFFVFLPFMLIAGILAVVTLMMLMKLAARIGIRRLLAVIAVVYLSAIYLYFKIVNPVQLVSEVMKHYPDVNEYFGYLDPPLVHYLPSHWVSEFFYWSTNGEIARAVPYFTLLLLTMLGLMIVAGFMARRYYYSSWVSAADALALGGRRHGRSRMRFLEFGRKSPLEPQTDVIVKRDLWLFFREPSQWLHMVLMIVLILIFVISLSTLELKLSQPFLEAVTFLVVFLFNGFLIASMSLRFVFPSVSLESESFWCIRSSPLSLKKLYFLKLGIALMIVVSLAEALSIVSIMILLKDAQLVLYSSLYTFCIALSLTSLNLGAGTYFALYKEKNPIRVASSQGASLTFLLGMIYLIVVVGSLIFPLNRYFESMVLLGTASGERLYSPLTLLVPFSVLVFMTSTVVGLKSLQGDFRNA
jgi:ABC-2 type transport system permease protein